MMENAKLGDVIEFQRGFDLTHSHMNGGRYPVIGSTSVIGFHDEYKAENGIVLGRSGTAGKPQLILGKYWPHNTCLFSTDLKGNDLYFLYYFLSNYDLNHVVGGSNIPTLNRNFLRPLPILIERDVNRQKKISHILRKLDLKIENNKRINFELESIIETIFGYWFLQFDFPSENGEPYQASGGKMVWNNELKRKIPERWIVTDLSKSDLCSVIPTGVREFRSKTYLATADVDNEEIIGGEVVEFEKRESRANMQPCEYSVWFAKMKDSIKHVSIPGDAKWFVDKHILSTGFYGLQCNKKTFAYVHSFINDANFEKRKDVLSHGSTQKGISDTDLVAFKFARPSSNILEKFSNVVNPMLEKKFLNIQENQILTSLRNFLLPMLMNGQAVISD